MFIIQQVNFKKLLQKMVQMIHQIKVRYNRREYGPRAMYTNEK